MRDVFGLQWLFLHTVFVQKEENTRPEGFKTYFITPPGYLSSCSLKHRLNQFTLSAPDYKQQAWIPNLPSASLFRQISWHSHLCNLEYVNYPSSLTLSPFRLLLSHLLSKSIQCFVHTHPELCHKFICVLWQNNLSSPPLPPTLLLLLKLAALTPAPIASSLHFSFSIRPPYLHTINLGAQMWSGLHTALV